jgi:hypothetical protein
MIIALAFILTCRYAADTFSRIDAYSGANQFRDEVFNAQFSSGMPSNVLTMNEMDKNLLIGKITSVMHYRVGQLIGIQERDGNIALYDTSGYRATLSETEEGSGVFELTNLQLRYSDIDWDAVKSSGAANWLGDYLDKLGFCEGGHHGQEGAHALGDRMGEDIIAFMEKNGLNASFSFAQDSFGILKCTLSLDGKPQNSIAANGDLTAQWIYDKNTGALRQAIVYNFSPAAGDNPAKWVATVTYYNSSDKEDKTYRCDVINKGSDIVYDERFPIDYEIDYAHEVLTTIYHYDANGARAYETNVESNDITYYSFGRPIEVVHVNPDTKHRTITSRYTYYSAGTLKGIISYNDNGEQSQVMVFSSRGSHLGTGSTQNPEDLVKYIEVIDKMLNGLDASNQDALLDYIYDNNLKEIYLTADKIKNPYVFMSFFLSRQEQEAVLEKIADATLNYETLLQAIDDISKDLNFGTDEARKAYQSVKEMYDNISKLKKPFKIAVESGRTIREEEKGSKEEQAYEVEDGEYVVEIEATKYYEEFTNKTLKFTIEFIDSSYTKCSLASQRDLGTTSRTIERTENYSCTYDPAVVGEAKAFVGADGSVLNEYQALEMIENGQKVYIQLNPKSINMFDGAGFKDFVNPQDGEEIFVAVEDISMFFTFRGLIGTDTKVMVVGVVTNDIGGKLTMQVHNTAEGSSGYTFGQQVQEMIDEINALSSKEGSWVYKNTQTNRGIFQAAGAIDNVGYLSDWKAGWAVLARLTSGEKFEFRNK